MNRRTAWGIAVSALWVLFVALMVCTKAASLKDMKLNEIGDFLAGAVSPLAFLWLVIGYFQQGEELKLNTLALTAQVLELKNSVEQQTALVNESSTQTQILSKNFELDAQIKGRELVPFFRLSGEFDLRAEANSPKCQLQIANDGAVSEGINVKVTDSKSLTILNEENDYLLRYNESKTILFDFKSDLQFPLQVDIIGGRGTVNERRQRFEVNKVNPLNTKGTLKVVERAV